jgi:hypothetical protein
MKSTSVILLVCLIVGLVEVSLAHRNREHRRNPSPIAAAASSSSTCPPRRRPCTKDCGTRGFMRSEAGCELCACNPLDCPALECPDDRGVCPHGWREDENGCRLCECKTAPRCTGERPMCSMSCPLGFRNGPDGCPTCQCFDPASPAQLPATDAVGVEHRSHRDHRVHRDHHQPSDRAADRREHRRQGDTGAAAAQLPAVLSVTGTESTPVACPPICMMECPNGMKEDANGCAICECNDEGESSTPAPGRRGGSRRGGGRPWRRRGYLCTHPRCAMFCPNGNRRDQDGCTLCECHQPGDAALQMTVSPSLQCPALRCHRSKKCANGFATDSSSGCPSCVCQS